MLRQFLSKAVLALLTLSAIALGQGAAQAQRGCGTDILLEQRNSTPEGRDQIAAVETQIRNWIHQNAGQRSATATYIIPTVVHIVQETATDVMPDACVYSQIEVLNEDFQKLNADTTVVPAIFSSIIGNCEVEFCLATIDPNGNPTTGITRTVSPSDANHSMSNSASLKGLIQWDPSKYFNIWVPKTISGGILGYATFPGGAPSEDGVVVNGEYFGRTTCATPPYALGRTATHEVGHWLGLYHTFQGGCAGTTQFDCATSGDNVCDTPPTASSNFGCTTNQNSCTETPTDMPDQTVNYMDYGDDNCIVMFSQGQVDRMQGILNTTRASLISQANHSATGCGCSSLNPCTPIANFNADNVTLCPGQTVQFTDLSNGPASAWSWSFPGGNPSSSTLQNPTVTYASSGTYDVSLIVTNSLGNDTELRTSYVSVVQAAQPPVQQGFETTLPADWAIINEDNQDTWGVNTAVFSEGFQCMAIDNWVYQATGTVDEISTNIIDLSTYATGELTFDYSYKRNSFRFDTLNVYFSADCGESWDLVWSKGGPDLATVAGVSIATPWVPSGSADWLTESIDLSSYLGTDGFKAKFSNVGWQGNVLYLDAINLSAAVSAAGALSGPQWNMEVQPNPFSSELLVNYELKSRTDIEFVLTDLNGREIYRSGMLRMAPGSHQFELPGEVSGSLGGGIYFLQGRSDQGNVTQKVVKMN